MIIQSWPCDSTRYKIDTFSRVWLQSHRGQMWRWWWWELCPELGIGRGIFTYLSHPHELIFGNWQSVIVRDLITYHIVIFDPAHIVRLRSKCSRRTEFRREFSVFHNLFTNWELLLLQHLRYSYSVLPITEIIALDFYWMNIILPIIINNFSDYCSEFERIRQIVLIHYLQFYLQ